VATTFSRMLSLPDWFKFGIQGLQTEGLALDDIVV
jgi:hypothetical protein